MKRIKNIIALVITLIMLMGMCQSVVASTDFFKFVNYSVEDGLLAVCGKMSVYNTDIAVFITSEGKIVYADSVKTGDYGFF